MLLRDASNLQPFRDYGICAPLPEGGNGGGRERIGRLAEFWMGRAGCHSRHHRVRLDAQRSCRPPKGRRTVRRMVVLPRPRFAGLVRNGNIDQEPLGRAAVWPVRSDQRSAWHPHRLSSPFTGWERFHHRQGDLSRSLLEILDIDTDRGRTIIRRHDFIRPPVEVDEVAVGAIRNDVRRSEDVEATTGGRPDLGQQSQNAMRCEAEMDQQTLKGCKKNDGRQQQIGRVKRYRHIEPFRWPKKQRQGRAEAWRVPARWQGRPKGGGDRRLAGGTSFCRLLHHRTRHTDWVLRRKAQFEKLELCDTTTGSILDVSRKIDTRIPLARQRARKCARRTADSHRKGRQPLAPLV